MSAGMSKQDFNRRVYRRLKRLERELFLAGVDVIYRRYQLFPDTTHIKADIAFNVSYTRLNASNGEVAGMPTITVWVNGNKETYGYREGVYQDGGYEDGVKRIKTLFAKPKLTLGNKSFDVNPRVDDWDD